MDIVTHGLAGGLVGLAGARRHPTAAVAAAVAGAVAPDLDVLARLWDPLAALTVHRTATHSVVGGLALALVVTAALRVARARGSVLALTAFAYAGVLSHIALDLLNPMGTAVLWPFDTRRVGLGWLYVIDPVVLALVAGGCAAACRWPARRIRTARVALGVLAVYAGVAGVSASAAERELGRLLAAHGVIPARRAVVPVFPGPARWMGVADAGAVVYRSRFWLGPGPQAPLAVAAERGPARALDVPAPAAVQRFLAVARVPWRTEHLEAGERVVEYADLAFEDHPWGGPMALRLRVDASGTVVAIDFGHRL